MGDVKNFRFKTSQGDVNIPVKDTVAREKIGDLDELHTQHKDNLVNAINDLEGGSGSSDNLWYPTVDSSGNISWQKSETETPPTVQNIKGQQGEQGERGEQGIQGVQGQPGRPGTGGYTPVGSVITMSGNAVPDGFLACDGTVYNIADYPHLAQYYEESLGASNFYGGDGVDTFAVPDYQGEFLRSTGTNSHTNQGSGSSVGVHQDGTAQLNGYAWNNGQINMAYDGSSGVANPDAIKNVDGRSYANGTYTTGNAQKFISRPTNTSVLYCVAYEDIVIQSIGAEEYNDLYDRPVEADAIDMDSVVNPLPSESGGYVQRGAMSIIASSNSINNFLNTISTPVTVERI